MQLLTSRFGAVELNPEDIFYFEGGIPGFEQHKRFVFLHPESDFPFSFMQSVDDGELSFIVLDPFLVLPEYDFHLAENHLKELEIEDPTEVAVWGIVSVREDLRKATINLKAPVVLNVRKKKGKQIVLHELDYSIRHPLFPLKPAVSTRKGE